MKKTILIVGCGDVARRAIPWLNRRFRIVALVRRPEEGAALRPLGVRPLLGDLDDRHSLGRLAGIADYVLHAAPPPAEGVRDCRTRRLIGVLKRGRSLPQALCYISTTGVYGDCRGAWVDESRPVAPCTDRARRRVDAERVLRGLARDNGVRVSILRSPGIYAHDRLSLARLERGDPILAREDDVFTNHIHADDLAQAAALALFRGRPARSYNVVDETILTMGDYFDLLADHFGLPRPPRVSRSEAAGRLSPVTLSFMCESRRLRNERMKTELRLRLAYPTVAAGLGARPIAVS
jgi:nucleoside-diphosphate-sugar epimerase